MRRVTWAYLGLLLTGVLVMPGAGRADTVASLLGNFTINQFCGLQLASSTVQIHYVVVFGQLPALRELHLADADRDGVTSQAERDAYIGKLAPGFAQALTLRVDGARIPLHAIRWSSSLPTEQGGFSLRIDVDFAGELPQAAADSTRTLEFANQNYAGRVGWHEIVLRPAAGVQIFNTDAYSTSLTGGLSEALQSVPATGPLDERAVHLSFGANAPLDAKLLSARLGSGTISATLPASVGKAAVKSESEWIADRTRQMVGAISGSHLQPRAALLTLLGALLLGAVHALSPGHGKTIVGAYLIGSRGTPRHALFLGLTVTITHTLGVFALGFATLYASRYVVPERLFPILSLLSAALVLLMGIVLLVQRGRIARRSLAAANFVPLPAIQRMEPHATAPVGARGLIFTPVASSIDKTMHSHGGGPMHSHAPPGASGEKISWRSLLALGISGGLVPCPSAMVLLLAAVALNKTAYGMLLVVAFSVGLAITLTLVGLVFLYARNRFQGRSVRSRWAYLLPVMSACTITVLGIALCVGALRSIGA